MSRILVIEDNELNRDMLSRRLIRRGYEILSAIDGLQGLAMARSEQPDLILLDMRLPGMDGWQVAQELDSSAGTQHIPVIALTAHAIAGDREKALEAGCDDYETKPINFARLLEKIEVLLNKEAVP